MTNPNPYVAGSYSATQQVYALNQIINAAFGVTEFNTVDDLQQFVSTVITNTLNDAGAQNYMGNDWQMPWGPFVFSSNPGLNSVVADNTMALFYSPNQKMYVLAIAGTNIDSAYGWLQEDFNTTTTVLWSDVMGNGFNIPSAYANAAISTGSDLGLKALLQMDNNGFISALTSSLNSLTAGSKVSLYVSGHSLGGALSPVMALYLHDLQQLSNNWNANGCVTNIYAMPTAGPTPGEANFAAYYSNLCAQKPASGAAIAYTSVYNTLDIVPHSWEQDELAAIPTIYDGNITQPVLANPRQTIVGSLATGAFLKGCNTTRVINLVIKKITVPANTYTQVSAAPAVRTAVTGNFNTTIDSEITSKTSGLSYILPSGLGDYGTYFVNFVRFLAQAGYQHTVAYSGDATTVPETNGILKVVEVWGIFTQYKQNALPSHQTEADLHLNALSRVTGLDLRNIDTAELDGQGMPASEA